jgi:mannose-6-phosphate isomerase-like protein (cupin superfamily)
MSVTFKSPLVVSLASSHTHFLGAGGLTATTKVPNGSVEGQISIIEHTLEPHILAAPLHRHSREDEISYIISGELTVLQEGEITVVKAGEYVTKPRGLWHTMWNAGSERTHMIEIITPGGFEGYFAELDAIIPKQGMPDMGQVLALGARYGLDFDLNSIPELLGKYQLGM